MNDDINKITGNSGNQFLKDFLKLMLPSIIVLAVFIIMIFGFLTPFLQKQHMKHKEDECRHLVDVVMHYLTSLHRDSLNGLISEAQAQERAFGRIRDMRYGDETKDYFWIIDSRGVILMHPYRMDIENVDPEKVTAPDGRLLMNLMREMSDIANINSKGGTVRYIWNRRDEITRLGSKIAHVRKFEPWGWILGTGLYIDEAEKEIESWRRMFISVAIMLAIFSAGISLILSHRAYSSRKIEEETRRLLLESETNLRLREELFRSIFEKSPHAIVITDLSHSRVINANRALADMTGYTINEIISDIPYTALHPVSEIEIEKMKAEIDSAGVAENINSTLITKDKNRRDIIYSSALINYMEEKALLKMVVDLTEEKLLEEQLRQSQKMEVLGKLAGGIAHDFNNMLAVITGSAELLSRKKLISEQGMKFLTRILESCDKASALIRKLMLFSRKGQMVNRSFDVHEIIINVADILSHTIDKKIRVTLNLNAGASRISGDSALIENALLNMAINSRDAMPDGGDIKFTTSNIDIDSYFVKNHPFSITEGPYIEIDISDTGNGIEPALIRKIFEPFFTTKPSGKGTGLGLAAVYGTIREHNGTIDVYSEPGKGSVFKLYLPCDNGSEESVKISDTGPICGTGTILIIDDDTNIIMNLNEIISALGYTVFTASGGKEGIEIFRERAGGIDLVICDIIMPEISGVQTIKLLKEIRGDIRIIISSGFQEEDTTGIIEETGAEGFICKPFRMNELSRLIHDVLTKKSE